ncbi:MAG TPA: flagellar basal-body rod protein FlgF [Pseudolabrys sp.]|nr:flagellar basal-body rod protein FlgF [Pseudolabrys sp.]
MENASLVGLSRQVALERELAVIANNIANLNTTGFKGDGAIFEEFLSTDARAGSLSGKDARISFVQDRATWHDLSQGPIQQTGNPLDVAVQGNGFLVVQTARGERYTRNGSLQINATGQLVTSDGDQVLGDAGPITFQTTDQKISISAEGTISVKEGANGAVSSLRGKLRLVTFANAANLQKDGSSTFAAKNNEQPIADQKSHIIQGAVEKSNVRGVVEITRMIEVTRSYQTVANLLQQQSDLRQNAIDKLAEMPAAA